MAEDLSDPELMRRAAHGDQGAFAVLVERYGDVLLNFFLRKGVLYDDGQDLAQKTFLRLWKYRRKYSSRNAKFTTFLFLLAGQVALDFFRAAARRQRLERSLAETPLEREGRAWAVAPKDARENLSGGDVVEAVAALTPALRDVVELGVFQDLPYADVGEVLGIPVGTVKSRMFNALRKLKEMLNGK